MSKYIMQWFEDLSLVEKIEAYGELMYDMGACPFSAKKEEKELFQLEKKTMMELIKKQLFSL